MPDFHTEKGWARPEVAGSMSLRPVSFPYASRTSIVDGLASTPVGHEDTLRD
jgi:hypothetical protein